MTESFSGDDVGKTVENAEGREVGTVTEVDGATARVEPDPGLVDSIKASLGWETDADDAYEIDEGSVREIGEDRITLESEFTDRSEPRTEPGTAPERDLETGQHEAGGDPETGQHEADSQREGDGPVADDEGRRIDERTVRNEPPERDEGPHLGTTTDADERETNPRGEDDEPGVDRADDDEAEPKTEPAGGVSGLDEVEIEEPMDESATSNREGDPDADRPDAPRESNRAADVESGEREARGLEVDPSELTDDDPEAELRPGENVGERTDAAVEPDDGSRRTDAEVDREAISDAEGTPPGPTTEDATRTELEDESEDEDGAEPIDEAERDADEALWTQEETRSGEESEDADDRDRDDER